MSKIEKTFEGYFSGDGECFCWDVDWETYKQLESLHDDQLEFKREINIEYGHAPDEGLFTDKSWQIYPSQLVDGVGSGLDRSKKYKITLTVEEIE